MERPDPDALLDRIQREGEKQQRGRLKIFFGASAGVGKTYAMLQAAHRRHEEGDDVLIGIVETHGREETLALLDGLDSVVPVHLSHRGKSLPEFDLDGVLARHPQLVLVDELAHSNAPGARHVKRWQDVYELLDAGIEVYTTLNVQHLESLNDIVGQITGIRVAETVPDRVFDLADEVSLVDLPAEELLDRLRDGKVYMPRQAEHAIRNFFRKGNLIALRELALRRTADRVDAQMREYRTDRSIERIWQARERLLVCVESGPESVAMATVRAGARLAASLKADWIAVYVETPKQQRHAAAVRKNALDALKLASELGAETVTLDGVDPAKTLLAYARTRNVSKLVVAAVERRALWSLFQPPLATRLLREAGDIDVTLLGIRETRHARAMPRTSLFSLGREELTSRPLAYVYAALIGTVITLLAAVLIRFVDQTNLVMLYLLGVVFTAVRLGRGPGVVLSFFSVAAFDFFFVPPRLSLTVSDTQYLFTFVVMLLTSLTISHLTWTLRHQARAASLRERRTAAMYAMTRELGGALTSEQIVEIGTRHVAESFQATVAVLLPDLAEQVHEKAHQGDAAHALGANVLDRDIAQWVYEQQKPAGRGTDTLPASAALYLPLKGPMRTRGTLALVTADTAEFAVPEQQRMIEACASQIALALERVHYVEIAQEALLNMESERLRNALLAAVSHDLRTPLTSIVGLASVLEERERGAGEGEDIKAGAPYRGERSGALVQAIHEEALRMNGLVTNLLYMARLQAGNTRLKLEWSILEEVIGAALTVCRRTLGARHVTVRLPEDLPLVQLDAVLMERLLSNIFENAAKYTPATASLTISAGVEERVSGARVRVQIDDDGPGLPVGIQTTLFEKFTRGEKETANSGMGLGLAICKTIVEAHGGEIGALNWKNSLGVVCGARFWFSLPLLTPPLMEASDEVGHAMFSTDKP
jgi:two-component system sensor histidine kinase KdpD